MNKHMQIDKMTDRYTARQATNYERLTKEREVKTQIQTRIGTDTDTDRDRRVTKTHPRNIHVYNTDYKRANYSQTLFL